jgi:hypothetical protein
MMRLPERYKKLKAEDNLTFHSSICPGTEDLVL